MNTRNTLSRLLPLSLTLGLLASACDGDSKSAAKKDTNAAKADKDGEKADAPADEKPADAVPADAVPVEKPAEVAADEKPEEAAAEEKPEEAAPEPAADEPEAEEAAKADAKPKADPKPKSDPKPKADPKPKSDPKPAASTADGKALYLKKCKSCHGTTGAADTKLAQKHDIPSWKEAGWKGKWSLSKVKDIVNNGKSGTKMKAFKSKLTPEEIDAVSAYSRSLGK